MCAGVCIVDDVCVGGSASAHVHVDVRVCERVRTCMCMFVCVCGIQCVCVGACTHTPGHTWVSVLACFSFHKHKRERKGGPGVVLAPMTGGVTVFVVQHQGAPWR